MILYDPNAPRCEACGRALRPDQFEVWCGTRCQLRLLEADRDLAFGRDRMCDHRIKEGRLGDALLRFCVRCGLVTGYDDSPNGS